MQIFVRLKYDLNNFSVSVDMGRYFCSLLHIPIQVLLTDNPKIDLYQIKINNYSFYVV